MHRILCLTIAAIAVVFVSFPNSTPAQVASTQIMLTEKYIEGFIAVQKDMSEVIEKMQAVAFSDPAAYNAKLMTSTKKRGFKNIAEYEAVEAKFQWWWRRLIRRQKNSLTRSQLLRKRLKP